MIKKLTFALATITVITLGSCGSESAADYGHKFCDCVKEKEGMHEDCAKIMEEAKKKFPDGKEEFMGVAKECMNGK